MSSEAEWEIRFTHLEDQMNRMNLILADQSRRTDQLTAAFERLNQRLKILEDALGESGGSADLSGPSEMPPDGVNR